MKTHKVEKTCAKTLRLKSFCVSREQGPKALVVREENGKKDLIFAREVEFYSIVQQTPLIFLVLSFI